MKRKDTIVAKFGGTSCSSPVAIKTLANIVKSNPKRRIVVVSAPGNRGNMDTKVTDRLLSLHEALCEGGLDAQVELISAQLRARFGHMVNQFSLKTMDINREIQVICDAVRGGKNSDFVASRGEYLCARIVAEHLGFQFIDASELILFTADGALDWSAMKHKAEMLLQCVEGGVVVPGFYGSKPDGSIKTFSRGGSDITGSIVAALAGAELYENWTDVTGVSMADPRIVPDARQIRQITYADLQEFAYGGAGVLHSDAVEPARDAGIPIQIMSTLDPTHGGTLVIPGGPTSQSEFDIVGVAGRDRFQTFTIEKSGMEGEVGFFHRLTDVFHQEGFSVERITSGNNTVSVVVNSAQSANGKKLGGVTQLLADKLAEACQARSVIIEPHIAQVCVVVGQSSARRPGIAAKILSAVAGEDIDVRMLDQPATGTSITFGVASADMKSAIRAVYRAFVP